MKAAKATARTTTKPCQSHAKNMPLEQELFAIEWTVEVTTARCAVWNGEMQKLAAEKKQVTTKILEEVSSPLVSR